MNKKLTAKLQKIQPDLPSNSKIISGCFNIEPETKELILKKGVLYGVYSILSNTDLNVVITTKMFNDVLHDSYYSSDNISPIQSLEKALLTTKEHISRENSDITIDATCSVLWGNVLYIVQMGEGDTYLMRDSDTRKISSLKEGNFSSTSGVIKADDVIVLCTKSFAETYTPQKLLSTNVVSKDLELSDSGLILKFIVDLSFSDDEVLGFSAPPIKKQKENPVSLMFSKISLGVTSKISSIKANKAEKKVKTVNNSPLVQAPVMSTPVVSPEPKSINPVLTKETKKAKKLSKKLILAAVVILLLIGSITYSLFKRDNPSTQTTQEQIATDTPEPTPEPTEPEHPPIDITQDSLEKVTRIEDEPFYDIRITDSSANPTEIAVQNTDIFVTDKTSGKIYKSSSTTPKFTALTPTFVGIRSIHPLPTTGTLAFSDAQGYKTIDGVGGAKEIYDLEGLGATKSYLTNIYSIDGDTLNKYSKSGSTLNPTLWAESPDFENAKDMDIAISIFVITNSGNLVKYTTGDKDTFTVTGLTGTLGNLCCIWTDLDSDYIYVADPTNKRVVVLDKEGTFIRQYKHIKENDWSDIKDFFVDISTDKAYLLTGSRVYVFSIAAASN